MEERIVLKGEEDNILVFLATMVQVAKDMDLELTIIVDEK